MTGGDEVGYRSGYSSAENEANEGKAGSEEDEVAVTDGMVEAEDGNTSKLVRTGAGIEIDDEVV